MATFDFVNAASTGYKFTWKHRAMLARYGLPLFLIRFASYVIITSFDLNLTPLRQGLVLLPSFFVEGWLLAVFVRFYMQLPKNDPGAPRAVLAATLLYVLIKLFLSVTMGLSIGLQPVAQTGADLPPPTLGMFAAAMIALSAMVWAFRLLWFYIPVAFNYSLKAFAQKISGYMTSLYMIAAWLMCLLPPAVFLLLCSQVLLMTMPQDVPPGAMYHFIMIAAQAIVEILIAVISTIAMTEAIRSILFDRKPRDVF